MMKPRKKEKLVKILKPIEEDVFNLLDMFEFYLMERRLEKPIEILADSIRDMRIIVQRILMEYFLETKKKDEDKFIKALAAVLAKRSMRIPYDSRADKKYIDYCVGEMITAFEWAAEIKKEYPNNPDIQRILAVDIPVLRPFDYGLRAKIRLVPPPRKKR